MVDLRHRLCHILMYLNNIWCFVVKRLLDVRVKAATLERTQDDALTHRNLPGIDVYRAQMQLIHDRPQRRHTTCYELRLVRESLEETVLVLLAVETDDECLCRRWGHSLPLMSFAVTNSDCAAHRTA